MQRSGAYVKQLPSIYSAEYQYCVTPLSQHHKLSEIPRISPIIPMIMACPGRTDPP